MSRAPVAGSGWGLWRDAALASAGFPAGRIAAICDEDLAAAADLRLADARTGAARYETAYAKASERLSAAIRETAMDHRFREAVTWQAPALAAKFADRAAAGKLTGNRGRIRQQAVARCLQRYCLSNETLGFFGPIGWAWVGQDSSCIDVTPGPGQLSRRTTYFHSQPIQILAARIAERRDVLPWLTPRVAPSAALERQVLRLPFREPITLSASEAEFLARCDGTRTVLMLTGDPADPGLAGLLRRLCGLGAVQMGLDIPVSTWPELELQDRITRIADPAARARAMAPLAELVAARDAVSAAAGDADRLHRATVALAEVFERLTGRPATCRTPGGCAGGSLVYEDTVRDVTVHIGTRLTDMLAPALGMLLDSATWLVNTIAARYLAAFRHLAAQAAAGNGTHGIPLLQVAVKAMPELFLPTDGREPAIVAEAVAEFQERWRRILAIPPGTRRHCAVSDVIAGGVAREFATGPALWSGARLHSVDVMIAAPGVAAIARGECQFILNKLHLATNSLESRVFVAQHPDPGRLLAAAEADYLDRRVYAIPKQNSPFVTSRLSPPSALLSPRYTYLCLGSESVAPPAQARVLPAVDLMVEPRGDGLVVRSGKDGLEYDFAEVLGDMLTALVSAAFRPLDTAGHRPRISVDTMVMARESWTFPAAVTGWGFVRDERRQYLLARRWRAEHGLPERAFVSAPTEGKPIAVDFRSPPLVGILAAVIRRAARHDGGSFTLTEMLPDTDQLWLRDAAGDQYTAELKFVAVNRHIEIGHCRYLPRTAARVSSALLPTASLARIRFTYVSTVCGLMPRRRAAWS